MSKKQVNFNDDFHLRCGDIPNTKFDLLRYFWRKQYYQFTYLDEELLN